MDKSGYRSRIYNRYVSARSVPLAPDTINGLKSRAPYIRRLIQRHFPADRGATILDLGCGHGAIVHFAREVGYTNVEGVDGSPEQVAVARQLGIDGINEGDLLKTLAALPAASRDCIVTFDVIEHFTRDELIGLVDHVQRVLKPGGRWIIHTVNGESPFAGRVRFGDLTHELAFTRTSIAQLLLASGFREVRSYEDEPIPHGLKSLIRWVLWKIIRTGLRLYLLAETGDTGRDAIFSQNFLTVAVK